MATKKRSYTERMKHERLRREREEAAKKRQKRNLIIILISVVLFIGVIVGLVFGIKAINYAIRESKRLPEHDYSVYKDTWDTTEHDLVYAEIKIKGYDAPIKLVLDKTVAPTTVANFVSLAESGFYNGLTFHRVIEGFMIQGGDPLGDGTGGNTNENGKKLTIKGEFTSNGFVNNMKHLRGVISMARGSENDSASSQFFICTDDASWLDGDYATFGYVVEGLITVDRITEDTADYGDEDGFIKKERRRAVIEYVNITGRSGEIDRDENETEEDRDSFS